MDLRERLRQLRAAVASRDGETLLALLQDPWPEHSLQLIGDGLLDALGRDVTGARGPASVCVAALRERDWEGDEELAAALDARLDAGATPLLRPLPVDLEQLADVLEGDPVAGGGRIDLQNGEVWPASAIEYAIEVGDEDEDETIASAGCGSRTRAHGLDTATWNASPRASRTPTSPTGSKGPWTDVARSAGSGTS